MAEGGSFNEVSVYGPKECRIIAIGKVGNGKSKTGNNLLGRDDAFKSRCGSTSVTERCQFASAFRFGKNILYIDTPGLFEIEKTEEAIVHEISKSIGLSSPGPHAFLLITKVDRFTQEDKDTIDICEKIFGKEFYKHLMVVFTHKKMLDDDKMTIQQYIEEPSDLKDFVRENNLAYIAIENSSSPDEKEEQMHELFSLIEDVVKKNKGNHFTNATYVQTEKVLLQEENRRRESRKAALVNSISQMETTLNKEKISVGAQENAELITNKINQLEKDHHKMKCELAQIQRELRECPNGPGMFRDDVRREIESSKLIHVIKQIGVFITKWGPTVISILNVISGLLPKKLSETEA